MLGPSHGVKASAPLRVDDEQRPWPAPGRELPSPLPEPRGPLSAWVARALSAGRDDATQPPAVGASGADALGDEDLHCALYTLYELHYRGLRGVDERLEWDPGLLRFRAELESRFEAALRHELEPLPVVEDVPSFLQGLTSGGDGPSLAASIAEEPELARLQEQAIHRAAWQLKEADPHSWAIPRLAGRAKAALIEIQVDEYGGGVERDIHAELYALTMERLGLSSVYNAYVDALPGSTLATVNLVSMFGLHRRLVGALVGHLAVFEMTSTRTMAYYAKALRDLGFDPWSCLFYDTHVVADAHHQTVAAVDLVGGLLEQDASRADDVVFGALSIELLEGRVTRQILDSWEHGRSSLRGEVDLPSSAPGQLLRPAPGDDPRRRQRPRAGG